MKIDIRIAPFNAETNKAYGWTKRHRLLEMFIVGKWRAIGFYTEKQIANGVWHSDARNKLATNAGIAHSVSVTFQFPS